MGCVWYPEVNPYTLPPPDVTDALGNKYSITNISDSDAILNFSQSRKLRMREEEEAASNKMNASQTQRSQTGVGRRGSTPASAGPSSKRKRGSLNPVQEDEEEEEGDEEESEEEVVVEKVKAKKKGRAR